jgi:hypothetical protein
MVSVAAIAARVRPSLTGAALLTTIAVVPWAEQHQSRVVSSTVDNAWSSARAECRGLCVFGERPGSRDGEIVLTPWDRVQLGPQHFEVLVPPTHPDAQDWPRGMVIGRNAPSVDPGIQQWFGSPLANVMSVFLAPWAALADQLDS